MENLVGTAEAGSEIFNRSFLVGANDRPWFFFNHGYCLDGMYHHELGVAVIVVLWSCARIFEVETASTRLCLGTQLTMLSFLTGEVADGNCVVHAWMFICSGHSSTKPSRQ